MHRLLLPAALFLLPPTFAAEPATLNDKVTQFAAGRLGKRVAGGECAHLATEALREAGARFIRPADSPGRGDYVWGTLVGHVEAEDGKAVAKVKGKARPGDVIQYRDATFATGGRFPHHTALVAEVNERGQPTAVYEQNIGPPGRTDRTVRRSRIDLDRLTGGWARIYRPEKRPPHKPGRFEFTVINNAPEARDVDIVAGTRRLFTLHLSAENTERSYGHATVSATSAPTLVVGEAKATAVDGACFEVFTKGGRVAIRRLP